MTQVTNYVELFQFSSSDTSAKSSAGRRAGSLCLVYSASPYFLFKLWWNNYGVILILRSKHGATNKFAP